MTRFEQFMVTLPKPFGCRVVVYADGAVAAVCQAIAGAIGVPVHEVWAATVAGMANQPCQFRHGDETWQFNPARIARRARGRSEVARAVEVSRFRGDPELPLGMEVRP